jgi:hypothetical protein
VRQEASDHQIARREEEDHFHDLGEVAVQDLDDIVRVQPGGEGGEPPEVAKKHGDLSLFAPPE